SCCSATAGVLDVQGASLQVGVTVGPGTIVESPQVNPRPAGTPTTTRMWLAGPRQVSTTRNTWLVNSTDGALVVFVNWTLLGRTVALVQLIVPSASVRPCSYQMWWSRCPVHTARMASWPLGSRY